VWYRWTAVMKILYRPSFVIRLRCCEDDRLQKYDVNKDICITWFTLGHGIYNSAMELGLWFKVRFNTRKVGSLREDHLTILITSPSVLLRMRNDSDKNCIENQNTHFVFNNFFRKSCCLWDIVDTYCTATKVTDDHMITRIAC